MTDRFAFVLSHGDDENYGVEAVVLDESQAHEIASRWNAQHGDAEPTVYVATPPERGEPAYPCGCSYSSWNDLGLPYALVRECAKHAVITEMESIVATEAHRISLEVDDD